MTTWGVDLVALVSAALVFWASSRVALGVLLAVAVLVPTPLVVPHMHTAMFTLQRLLVVVVAVRLVRMAADRRPSLRRPRDPATLALVAVIVASFVVGIVASPSSAYNQNAGLSLASLLAQLGFLLACFALVRELVSPWEAIAIATGVMFVDAGIGIVEHLTANSWGHWWMGHLPGQGNTDASFPLAMRDGQTRVKAGSEFALQFGWIMVALLPCALALATRLKAGFYLAVAAVVTAGLAVYWSYSRSALAALVPAVALTALLVRHRRLSSIALTTVLGGVLLYALSPSLAKHVSASAQDVSVATRFHKLQPIFGQVAQHPFRGLGLGNLTSSGYHTTDNALLLVYIELGVIGLVFLSLLFVTVAGQTLRAYVVAAPDERAIAAACFVSVLAYIVSTQIYDAFTLIQGPQVMWFLIAVATVVAERAGRPIVFRRLRVPRLAIAVGASLALGGALLAFAPSHVGYRALVLTEPAYRDALPYNTINGGKYLLTTACTEAERIATTLPGTTVDCRAVPGVGGVGELYLQAATRSKLTAAKDRLVSTISGPGGVRALQLHDIDGPRTGHPTVLRTAPVWLPLLALGLYLLPPLPPRRGRTPLGSRRRMKVRIAI